MGSWIRGWLYRSVMKVAHRFNWHYAPPIYPEGGWKEGSVQLWCQWCGFRQTMPLPEREIRSGWRA